MRTTAAAAVACVAVLALVLGCVPRGAEGAVEGTVEHVFHQQVDHFANADNTTFEQRFTTLGLDTYTRGEPVFFFLSGEAPMEAFEFQEVQAQAWAAKHNALFVVLEHRFYGKSMPMPDWSTESLGLLSSEQALADAAWFIVNYSAQLAQQGKEPGPWVVIGCSYSAGLAAWFRARHPELVVGAVCPSGPVQAEVDQSDFLAWFQYAVPSDCLAAAKEGVAGIEAELARGADGLASLTQTFNACEPLTQDDVQWFLWNVALAVGTIDQFSNPVPLNTLTQGCGILTQTTNKIEAFAKIVATSENVYFTPAPPSSKDGAAAASCTHLSQSYFVEDMSRPDNPNRSWFYQKMTEFGYLKTSVNGSSIFFPSYDLGLDFILPVLNKIFGFPAHATPNVAWTNANYGAKNLIADNVLFTNGLLDPWHLISISKDVWPPSQVRAVTYEAGHCATLNAASPDDPPSLKAARLAVEAALDAWLNE